MFHRQPLTGEPAPWFVCATADTTRFHFDTVAGRHVVLCCHGSAGMEITRRTLAAFGEHAERFDAVRCCFFAVSIDPAERYEALSEFIVDLHRPNVAFTHRTVTPLAESNPLLFWKLVSALLSLFSLFLLWLLATR